MVNGEPCAPRGACTVLEGVSNAGLPHDLDVDVARLRLMKADHQSQQYRLEDRLLKHFPQEIERNQGFLRGLEQDHATVEAHPLPEHLLWHRPAPTSILIQTLSKKVILWPNVS